MRVYTLKTRILAMMAVLSVLTGALAFASVAQADSLGPVDFESPAFSLGNIDGQNGWSKTGPFDSEVDDSVGTSGFGDQSLRISNAVTSGSFGDQTFAPELSAGAGESGVATESHFEAEFDISSTMMAEQPGLALSVSPDDGNGSRMSYLGFSDEAGGIRVTFYDVTNPGPNPSGSSFNPTDLGTLDRSEPHTIKFVMDFVDGPGNDVVEIYIDGSLVHTGTSWEDYYRFDPEQSGNGNQLFPVDTLLIRAAGTAAPSTSGNGYLFDNVELLSGSAFSQPTDKKDCRKGGWKTLADGDGNSFKNQGQCIKYVVKHDIKKDLKKQKNKVKEEVEEIFEDLDWLGGFFSNWRR